MLTLHRSCSVALCMLAFTSIAAAQVQNNDVPVGVAHADELDWPTTLALNLADPDAPAPVEFEPLDRAAADVTIPTDKPAYKGGRGLVTSQGMSGMFLNPTSGTLDQGQFTLQYCVMFYRNVGENSIAHGLMAAYGIFDWLEVGAYGTYIDVDVVTAPPANDGFVGGPFFRIRILKDEGWLPELSVGGIWLDGDAEADIYSRAEAFLAMSKRFVIDEDGILKAVRGHLGMRIIWTPEQPNIGIPPEALPMYSTEANAVIAFAGLELELPYSFKLIGEISSKDDFHNHLPWAVGVQWQPNNVLGLSLAGASSQGEDRVSIYFGIGFVLQF